MKISVVIPVYNEENRIKKTAEILDGYLCFHFDDYEIIFSNDGSSDRTYEFAKKLEKEKNSIKVVGYPNNCGKGKAVKTGIFEADGDIVIFTDCDLAYGTDVIKKAVMTFEKTDADIVIGSRNLEPKSYSGYSFSRIIMSKVYFKFISFVTGLKLTDSQCGFKCFKKSAAREIFNESKIEGFAFDLEILLNAQDRGLKIVEIPVRIINNDNDNTKVRMIKDSIDMLKDIRRIKR